MSEVQGVEQPFPRAQLAPIEATMAVAGHVSREYGECGYVIGCEVAGWTAYLFAVRCTGDGSEFYLRSDRWGNVERVYWNGAIWAPEEASSVG